MLRVRPASTQTTEPASSQEYFDDEQVVPGSGLSFQPNTGAGRVPNGYSPQQFKPVPETGNQEVPESVPPRPALAKAKTATF